MKKIIIFLLLPTFFSLHSETKIETLYSQNKQNVKSFLKKALELHAKPAIAATSVGAGSYLLYDALKTTHDLQSSPQRNTQKGISLNGILGMGFIIAGTWFFKKYVWENEIEEEKAETSLSDQ